MITPDFLSYEMNLLKTHNELKESILRDVTRRIVKTGYVTDTAKYQAEKLQQCGVIYDDVINLVSEKTNETKSEIKRIFDDAKTEVFNYDDELIIDAGYEVLEVKNISPRMKRIINAAVKKTTTEAINLTKTTAITSQSLYISACDLAHQQIVSGAFTYTQAIKNAVISASKQGVNVVYPSGHISSLYSAVRRSVLTGVNQTYGKLQNMRAGELEIDIMELTAHMGARPEHSVWQGQLVSLSGQEGYLTTDDIGYGDVRGFMGANCRHNWHMFFPGSQRAYTQDELDAMRDTNVTYNGETIPYNEAVQKQRSMERGISKIKDSLVCIDEARKNAESDELKSELNIEFSNLSVKLKTKENKLKDFTNQTGLKRDKFREQVFANETGKGYGKSVSAKAVWENKRELTRQKENDRIKEIKQCGIRCEKINLVPKQIDVSKLEFDDEHINKNRQHNITKEQTISFIKNAKFSATGWKGKREKYYGYEGVAYVDISDSMIKTAFSKEEFDDIIKNALEVYKKYEKR